MKKGNLLDIGIDAVKRSGLSDITKKSNVQFWAKQLGFFEVNDWLEDLRTEEYLWYMYSIDFNKVVGLDSFDVERLEALGNLNEARNIIEEVFGNELADYNKSKKFIDFKQLPFSFSDITNTSGELKSPLLFTINESVDDHAYNYLLPTNDGYCVVFLSDYFYKVKGKEIRELTGKEWSIYYSRSMNLSHKSKCKFDIVNEQMRLAALLAN